MDLVLVEVSIGWISITVGVSLSFLCRRSVGFLSRTFLVFLMKESKKRRQKQPGKLMAKSHSQPVNLPGARPLMNPLFMVWQTITIQPSQNQPAAGSKSCLLWRFDCLIPIGKYITIIMKPMPYHLPSDKMPKNNKLCGDFLWEYVSIICGKQTELYKQISTVDKVENKTFQMY